MILCGIDIIAQFIGIVVDIDEQKHNTTIDTYSSSFNFRVRTNIYLCNN